MRLSEEPARERLASARVVHLATADETGRPHLVVATFAAGLTLMFGIKALGLLRVSEEGEIEGLDIHEHGAPAYHPEPSYEGYSMLPPGKTGAAPAMTGVGVPN